MYLGRARQLRSQGYLRDAVNVLGVAVQLDGASAAWMKQVAQELAACGAGPEALKLLNRLGPDPAVESKLLGQLADRAVERGPSGRTLLPAELQADFDRILQASAQIEAGQDEAARASLQPVGLLSLSGVEGDAPRVNGLQPAGRRAGPGKLATADAGATARPGRGSAALHHR